MEETWEKILPRASHFGVTRIANITGLDNTGIPTTIAIRPESKTVACSSGRGVSLLNAQVSGLMEAAEAHCVENVCFSSFQCSYNQALHQCRVVPFSTLPFRKNTIFHRDWPETWVKGWDLIGQEEVAVPQSVVKCGYKGGEEIADITHFSSGSNGLASGNNLLEAIVSGIYELIERDAITCCQYALETSLIPLPQVDLKTITYPSVLDLISKLTRAKTHLLLYDCMIDTKVPVFKALLYDCERPFTGIIAGYGAHLDPEVAMIRAITEAAQGRAVFISGARDDCFQSEYETLKKMDTPHVRSILEKVVATINASTYTSEATLTFEEDTEILIKKIKKCGLNQVIVFDLSAPLGENAQIAAVKVVIPGLEGYYNNILKIGNRAKNYWKQISAEEDPWSFLQTAHLPAGGHR